MEWIQGNDAGAQLVPVRKLLLHTTEGSTIEGAVAAYQANNSWPHETVDYRMGVVPRRVGHLTADRAARSLRNLSGGVETNRDGVYQIEVVGRAANPAGINWERFAREVMGPVCRQLGIPVASTVHWISYPASYGQAAAQRLSGAAWNAYQGILGHEHAPENDHGDPGAIPIQAMLAAAQPPKPPTPPSEEDDMPYLARNAVNGGVVEIGNGPPTAVSFSAYQAEVAVLKQINFTTTADFDEHLARAMQEWQCLAALTTISADTADIEALVGTLSAAAAADPATDPDPDPT